MPPANVPAVCTVPAPESASAVAVWPGWKSTILNHLSRAGRPFRRWMGLRRFVARAISASIVGRAVSAEMSR